MLPDGAELSMDGINNYQQIVLVIFFVRFLTRYSPIANAFIIIFCICSLRVK